MIRRQNIWLLIGVMSLAFYLETFRVNHPYNYVLATGLLYYRIGQGEFF